MRKQLSEYYASDHNTRYSKLSKHTTEVLLKQCRKMVYSEARLPYSMTPPNSISYGIIHNIPKSSGDFYLVLEQDD